MKWPRKVFFLLWLILVVWLAIWLYTFVHPLVQHLPKSGWPNVLVHTLLTSQQSQTLLSSPMTWVLLVVGGLMLLMMEIEARTRQLDTHGSAHHATRRERRPFVHTHRRFPHLPGRPRFPRAQRQAQEGRLVLGTSHGREISLSEKQQESNVIAVAPIGAGKSARIVIPNLLVEPGSRSLLISDVKGELARITAGAVSRCHEVWVFSPHKPLESEGYNPLAHIRSVEDAQEFARCWVENTGKSKEDFWPDCARRLMTAAILHLHVAEPDAPFRRVAEILCVMPYDEMKRTLLTSPSHKTREEVTALFDYLDKNPKLVGSLMADTGTRFQLLVSDQVRTVTANNDIDFRVMAERPIALYLSIPRRYHERYQPLLACFMLQAFAAWEERAEAEPDGRLPRRIMCYLDEFAQLGYISNFSSYISTARHSGVGMLMVLQSFSQVAQKYGRNVLDNILVNTVTHLLLPGAGLEETEYYSKRIGTTTVRTQTHNTSGSGVDSRESWTQGETGRRLMTPDELRTMPEDNMLMISAAVAPLILRTQLYFLVRRLAKLANLPFSHVARTHQQPAAPQTSADSPTSSTKKPPLVINSEQDDDRGNEQFFLQE
jgi:type IV secretion system protein VirD4